MDDLVTPKYRECFLTPAGQQVLANMLAEARFFEPCKTSDDIAVNNFMKMVLYKIGVWDFRNAQHLTDKILEVPTIERNINGKENNKKG